MPQKPLRPPKPWGWIDWFILVGAFVGSCSLLVLLDAFRQGPPLPTYWGALLLASAIGIACLFWGKHRRGF